MTRELHTPAINHADLRPGDKITWDEVEYVVAGLSRHVDRSESDPTHKYGSIAIPTETGDLLVPFGYLWHPVNMRRTDELATRTIVLSDLEWELLSNPTRCAKCGHLDALHPYVEYRNLCAIDGCYCGCDD